MVGKMVCIAIYKVSGAASKEFQIRCEFGGEDEDPMWEVAGFIEFWRLTICTCGGSRGGSKAISKASVMQL